MNIKTSKNIIVLDYGLNNIRSITNKLKKNGIQATGSSRSQDLINADKIILPGVGHFASAMQNLKNLGLIDILKKKVLVDKTPILGICLGMQLFASKSAEGDTEGLGFIDCVVEKFNIKDKNFKVPHVGWNTLEYSKPNILLNNIDKQKKFYFVHSYHYTKAENYAVARTKYGYSFVSIIQKDNIYGTQFHPEKSHLAGFKIIENFATL